MIVVQHYCWYKVWLYFNHAFELFIIIPHALLESVSNLADPCHFHHCPHLQSSLHSVPISQHHQWREWDNQVVGTLPCCNSIDHFKSNFTVTVMGLEQEHLHVRNTIPLLMCDIFFSLQRSCLLQLLHPLLPPVVSVTLSHACWLQYTYLFASSRSPCDIITTSAFPIGVILCYSYHHWSESVVDVF